MLTAQVELEWLPYIEEFTGTIVAARKPRCAAELGANLIR
jgi:hypothetical protein